MTAAATTTRYRHPRIRRALLAVIGAATALSTGTALAVAAPGPETAERERPTAAVALGDSFISGEGAGDYVPVPDLAGNPQSFPGWSAPNSDAFFCHRSANASIEVAALDGIDDRFNLACSGGQPHDITNPSAARESGRNVASQVDQLRSVAQTHDIELVLIGLGSNNSSFTFGNAAVDCAARFVADAYIGWWEFWVPFINWITGTSVDEDPCTNDDMATTAQLAAGRAETADAVRAILDTLDEVQPDGDYKVVLQDYTNPIAPAFHPDFHEEDGRTDHRDKFRDLARERYRAGCPVHVASVGPAYYFSSALGDLVAGVHDTLSSERPDADLVHLDVQHAFDGARLCEQSTSPDDALATPTRLQDEDGGEPTGVPLEDIDNTNKLDIVRIQGVCAEWFQTCQESLHPNEAGHAALGECLAGAWASEARAVSCTRTGDGSIELEPS